METYKTLALQKGQFFLSKLKSNVNVLDEEGKEVNIKKIMQRGIDVLELKVYMGGVPCRLVIQKLPDDVVNRKLRDAHRKAQQQGRTLSDDAKLWMKYVVFVSNLPDLLDCKALFTIYRLRWQIELIFEGWKSILKIHKLRKDKENRVWCEIFGKLIIAVFADQLTRLCTIMSGKDISTYKTLNNLRANGIILAFKLIAGKKTWLDYLNYLISQTIRLCKKNKQNNKPHISLLMNKIHIDDLGFKLA